MAMTFSQLEIFVKVASIKALLLAARQLGITQFSGIIIP